MRKMMLPGGWYPADGRAADQQFDEWDRALPSVPRTGGAGIVPHAGWFFSGLLAWRVLRRLRPAQVVVVLGGHLAPEDGLRAPPESSFETPFGHLQRDEELFHFLSERFKPLSDSDPDNTVEIQLPLVHRLFPACRVVCLRVPPSGLAGELGQALAGFAGRRGELAVIGSTDLTHYGPSYSFMPHGAGPGAVEWVRGQNDRAFIEAALAGRIEEMIRLGLRERAACSAGAAAAAAAFARESGLAGSLEGYATSLDRQPAASFVGYAGIVFTKSA